MRFALLVLLVVLSSAASFAQAAFYEWIDADGVVHITDNRNKIPKKYQPKARRLELPEELGPAMAAPPAPQAPTQPPTRASGPQTEPGGHTQMWWRERFASLRSELEKLQGALPQKEAKLVELRRQRVIFTRARDREAVNAMESEISADEARITELRSQIEALDQEAARAGVPAEWRR